MRRFLASLLVVFILLAVPAFAFAQEDTQGLAITTSYPSQVIRAGESVSVTLRVKNDGLPPQIVDLDLEGVPEGWQAHFQGAGRIIYSVFVETDDSQSVTLRIESPADAPNGTYPITVVARGENGARAELPLEFIIGDVLPAQIEMDVDLPVLKGTPDSTFKYRAQVKNDSEQDLLISLEALAPQGWDVTFKQAFGSQELTSVSVNAGEDENVDIEVVPPLGTPAGEYPITVRALAGELSAEVELTAVVTGRPELSITTPDGRLSGRAYSGQESPLEIVVRNTGSAAAREVELTASEPSRWEVTFDPEFIDVIDPNSEVSVTVNIKPPEQAVAGDYMITLRATPKEGSSESADFRITVLTSTIWGVVGIVVIAAALGVVALAVARFGRR